MRTLITGIGQVVSGDIAAPLLDADSIVIADGRIEAIGRGLEADADVVIDAHGTTVVPGPDRLARPPGLRRLHAAPADLGLHRVVAPRRRDHDDLGRRGRTCPAARRTSSGSRRSPSPSNHSYANVRPGGRQGPGRGADPGARAWSKRTSSSWPPAGVRLIGEIGLGSVKSGADAAPMVAWGRANGLVSTYHTGGPSLPGSGAIGADAVLEANPDIAGHINGGTTSLPEARHRRGWSRATRGSRLELVHCGNGRTALVALGAAAEAGALGRVILGNDAPSGTGVVPARDPAAHGPPGVARRGRPRDGRLPGDRQHGPGPRPGHRGARAGQRRGPVHRGRPGRLGRGHRARGAGERRPVRDLDGARRWRRRSSAGAGTPRRPSAPRRSSRARPIGGGGH